MIVAYLFYQARSGLCPDELRALTVECRDRTPRRCHTRL